MVKEEDLRRIERRIAEIESKLNAVLNILLEDLDEGDFVDSLEADPDGVLDELFRFN